MPCQFQIWSEMMASITAFGDALHIWGRCLYRHAVLSVFSFLVASCRACLSTNTHTHAQGAVKLWGHHNRFPFLCGSDSLALPVGQIISLDSVPLHICYPLNDVLSDVTQWPSLWPLLLSSALTVTEPRRAAAAFSCSYRSFSFSSPAHLRPTLQ